MELSEHHITAIEKTAALVAGLSEDMTEVREQLVAVQDILASHTSSLDGIARDVKDWNTELIAVRARLDRHDQWFKQVAESLHLKLK